MLPAERDIKIVRPLYSIEVTETETAKFETEISEDDVHGSWKLKGETLHQSAVSGLKTISTIKLSCLVSVLLSSALLHTISTLCEQKSNLKNKSLVFRFVSCLFAGC